MNVWKNDLLADENIQQSTEMHYFTQSQHMRMFVSYSHFYYAHS